MIALTHLDGSEFVLNSDHILWVDRTPDTVITLTSGTRLMVREPIDVLVARTMDFRRRLFEGVAVHGATPTPPGVMTEVMTGDED
jgi:flagellar protein FlbD